MTFGQRRRRPSDLLKGVKRIDYKNIELLERFLEGGGRLRSRRRTRTPAKEQRKITAAVKRARHVALIPYTSEQERMLGSARGRSRVRRDDRDVRSARPDRDEGPEGEDTTSEEQIGAEQPERDEAASVSEEPESENESAETEDFDDDDDEDVDDLDSDDDDDDDDLDSDGDDDDDDEGYDDDDDDEED